MENFASRLRELMQEINVTQKEVAIGTKSAQSLISRYLSGEKLPSIKKAQQIADYFGVDLNWLITGKTLQQRERQDFSQHVHHITQTGNGNAVINIGHRIELPGGAKIPERRKDYREPYITDIVEKLKALKPEERKKILAIIEAFIKG